MTETLLVMLLICLVFFGLMQVFHLAVAQMLADYSAWSATRAHVVGFDEQLTRRSAEVASIGASGKMTRSGSGAGTGVDSVSQQEQFEFEVSRIPYFIMGELYLEYDHWNTQYEAEQNDGVKDDETHLDIEIDDASLLTSTVKVNFKKYPLMFLTGSSAESRQDDPSGGSFFFKGDWTSIESGEDGDGVTLTNHANIYLE